MEVTRKSSGRKAFQDAATTSSEVKKLQPNDSINLKNGHRKVKKKRQRTKAVLIQPAKGRSYADLLKEIKAKANPSETQMDIKSIKQTRSGAVLLEISHNLRILLPSSNL